MYSADLLISMLSKRLAKMLEGILSCESYETELFTTLTIAMLDTRSTIPKAFFYFAFL